MLRHDQQLGMKSRSVEYVPRSAYYYLRSFSIDQSTSTTIRQTRSSLRHIISMYEVHTYDHIPRYVVATPQAVPMKHWHVHVQR